MTKSSSRLFEPYKLGNMNLQHRVVLCPLTRFRTTPSYSLHPFAVEYYAQRASVPGTLLIAEGTIVSPRSLGLPQSPGIWSDEQISIWKEVTNAVHDKGCYIFLQLYDGGRQAPLARLKELDPSYDVRGPSATTVQSMTGPLTVRAMTISEIKDAVKYHVEAAKVAIEQAGFDGVEIHGANGFLIDEFIQDVSNQRTDEYGGSIEKQSRLALEIVDEVVKAVGPEKTAFRISPWSTFFEMGMADPVPQFSHLVSSLKQMHPNLAFLHMVEPRMTGSEDVPPEKRQGQSNDFIRKLWAPKTLISAGAYTRDTGMQVADQYENELIAYGRHFLANPDLPRRLKENIPLNPYDRDTLYTNDAVGYTDYPFADAQSAVSVAA